MWSISTAAAMLSMRLRPVVLRAETRRDKDESGPQHLAAGLQELSDRGVHLVVVRGGPAENGLSDLLQLRFDFRVDLPRKTACSTSRARPRRIGFSARAVCRSTSA